MINVMEDWGVSTNFGGYLESVSKRLKELREKTQEEK